MSTEITKSSIDIYLKELAKEYRNLTHGNAHAEIVVAGGGAVLLNHDFRDSTQDIDAWIGADSEIKTAILRVADKFGLPCDWLNTGVKMSGSYSEKLREVSDYYKTFSNKVEIRVVPDEYLIAMKLVAGRDYKHDYSDIAGILKENAQNGTQITKESVRNAAVKLYGSENKISDDSWCFLDKAIENASNADFFKERVTEEKKNRELLSDFSERNPGVITERNIGTIMEQFKEKDESKEKDGLKQVNNIEDIDDLTL